jgi:hypothetical protein
MFSEEFSGSCEMVYPRGGSRWVVLDDTGECGDCVMAFTEYLCEAFFYFDVEWRGGAVGQGRELAEGYVGGGLLMAYVGSQRRVCRRCW